MYRLYCNSTKRISSKHDHLFKSSFFQRTFRSDEPLEAFHNPIRNTVRICQSSVGTSDRHQDILASLPNLQKPLKTVSGRAHRGQVGLCVGSYVTVRTWCQFGSCSVKSHSKTKHNDGISPPAREASSCGSEAVILCRDRRLFAGLTAPLHGRSFYPMMSASGVSHNVCSALRSIRDQAVRLSSSSLNIFLPSPKFYGHLRISVQTRTKPTWPKSSEQWPAASQLPRLV